MADITKILDEIKELTLMEVNDLVKALEEEFGVEIPSEDLEGLTTVGDVARYVESHQE